MEVALVVGEVVVDAGAQLRKVLVVQLGERRRYALAGGGALLKALRQVLDTFDLDAAVQLSAERDEAVGRLGHHCGTTEERGGERGGQGGGGQDWR